MTNAIDDAVFRIQALALGMTEITVKSAPDYPIESVDPLPMVVSYVGGGQAHLSNATMLHNFPEIQVEFHLSRINLNLMSKQINAIVNEFPRRLAGDPTLNGKVKTVVMTPDNPLTYSMRPFVWGLEGDRNRVLTMMVLFVVPIKLLPAPLTTA
jgi:hypothetical protein